MFKINKLTDYAVVLLGRLAQMPQGTATAAQLAEQTRVPGPTVAKVLKQLAKAGLVKAQRGATGGYELARATKEIGITDIITALEGPIEVADCAGLGESCAIRGTCHLHGRWEPVNNAIHHALSNITLNDMLRRAS